MRTPKDLAQLSDDREFLEGYGAEMFLEIAKFWSSLITFSKAKKRYEIRGVMGPDEYHEESPNATQAGLNNNAYTNVMAVWLFKRAFDVLNSLSSQRRQNLKRDLGIEKKDLTRWKRIIKKMFIPFHNDHIISQFEGYENLEEFDWEGYEEKYGNIERLDRILEAEGDTPNRYKVSKQADVCMLFFLLPFHTLKEIFDGLDYPFGHEWVHKNLSYYLSRTSHGSTLSKIVHASILNRVDRPLGWILFNLALLSDIEDVQGGTTPEGIHLGAMAGTVDIVLRDFSGIESKGEMVCFDPQLPSSLKELHFRIRYRKNWLALKITQKIFSVSVEEDGEEPILIEVKGNRHYIHPGDTQKFKI